MVTSTPTNHVVELTKIAPLLLAELTGIWSLLWGGTQLRMFTFNTLVVSSLVVVWLEKIQVQSELFIGSMKENQQFLIYAFMENH